MLVITSLPSLAGFCVTVLPAMGTPSAPRSYVCAPSWAARHESYSCSSPALIVPSPAM